MSISFIGSVKNNKWRCGLTAQVWWFGLRVGGRLALFYIHQMNRVNSSNGLAVVMTAV